MAPNRNEPCPCGSGNKFKACCARKRAPSHWLAIVSVVLFGLLAAWAVAYVVRGASQTESQAPPGKVWSAEHGHWHDAPSGDAQVAGEGAGDSLDEGVGPVDEARP